MSAPVTQFSLEYLVSVLAGLTAGYLVNRAQPRTNSAIKFFIVPLSVSYGVLMVVNALFPFLNQWGVIMRRYFEDKTLGEINDTGYMQIFPPLFAIFIVFIVLLYNRNLG